MKQAAYKGVRIGTACLLISNSGTKRNCSTASVFRENGLEPRIRLRHAAKLSIEYENKVKNF